MCAPKYEGGLGIKPTALMNQAYFIKLWWQLVTNPDTVWARVFRAKYLKGGDLVARNSRKTNLSPIWKTLVENSKWVDLCSSWSIGSGKMIDFWNDN